METPLVSAVIATYNGERYIERAVKSVLNQNYKNIELIIIDDGSNDKTESILNTLKNGNPKINIYKNNHNLGFAKSLNLGIEKARGLYIARLDDDDFWSDLKKIEKQVNFLQKHHDYVLVGGGMIKVAVSGKEIAKFLFPEQDEEIRKSLLVDNNFVHSTVLFRKDIFKKVGGYDQRLDFFADWGLWLKLGKEGKMYNFQDFFAYYLDKEYDSGYNYRNDAIRRKLFLNIEVRNKYRKDYKGFYRALFLCIGAYMSSYVPFRSKFWPFFLKIRILFFGAPPYRHFK